MTPRRLDYQERKDRILGIVVDKYIKTVNPVSSSYIVHDYFPDLSSATIRNILAELEEDGYLTHPHTSAGRVPTQNGYRYYVDNLMEEIQLLEKEKKLILLEYQKKMMELENLLEKTTQVVSKVTHYTSIISVDGSPQKIFCKGTSCVTQYPEFQDFNKINHLLSILEQKERLLEVINRELGRKIEVYIGNEILCAEMDSCSLIVSKYKRKKGPSGKIAVLGPTRMDYERVVSTLDYFSELVSEIL